MRKSKLAVVAKESQEEHRRSNQSWSTAVPRIQENFNTQVTEEIEERVSKKMFNNFSRTKTRFLGALSKLVEFNRNPQVWVKSGTVLGTSRISNGENQELNEDRSQNGPHLEVSTSVKKPHQFLNLDPVEVTYNHSVQIVQKSQVS